MRRWLLFFLLLSTSAWGAPSAQQEVRSLVDVIEVCVAKRDTAHPVFNGCVDWHSSVHGYWALLWGGHFLNDKTLTSNTLARLTDSGLNAELKTIKQKDSKEGARFEMPYGRAWFLQLARDAETLHDFHRLRPLADYLYLTLLQFARDGKGELAATDYDNASWYLYQLYCWASYNGYKGDETLLRNLVLERFSKSPPLPLLSQNLGFFEPKTMAALLLARIGKPEPIWTSLIDSFKDEPLQPLIPPFPTAHQGGLDYSRTWGLVALARATGDPRLRVSVLEHRSAMSKSIEYWSPRYHEFGHWVAQFGMFSYKIEHDGPG